MLLLVVNIVLLLHQLNSTVPILGLDVKLHLPYIQEFVIFNLRENVHHFLKCILFKMASAPLY